MQREKIIFHGACVGCVRQKYFSMYECMHCKFFDSDWDKYDFRITDIKDIETIKKQMKVMNQIIYG